MFQFLIVQLKVLPCVLYTLSQFVSIPYSTIKRALGANSVNAWLEFQFLIVQLKVPRGASLPISLKFQFLIVQLKDLCVLLVLHLLMLFQFLIVQLKGSQSISFENSKANMFQFLIVQLKAKCLERSNPSLEFQFLIVQLKVIRNNNCYRFFIVSIPYSTIKSVCLFPQHKF